MVFIGDLQRVTDLREHEQALPEPGVRYGLRQIDRVIPEIEVAFVMRSGDRLIARALDGKNYPVSGDQAFVLVPRPVRR